MPRYASTRGDEALEVARSVGLELDPFQEIVIRDSLGVRPDGRWAAFEVGVDLARQNGKGAILEVRELAGIFAFGERLILHSAHEFQTATEAMLRMEDLLAAEPDIAKQVKSVSRSHGSEGFIFKSGQRLRYRTRTKGGGRGFTGDTLVFDEAMILPETFVGALLPTLSGRSEEGNPQVFYAGSPVDQTVHEHGFVFARLRGRGLRGGDPSLAWFEWSAADALDVDGRAITPAHPLVAELLDDPDAWAAANPALGIRIAVEHVEKERRSMEARTFAVERLGVGDWPDIDASGDSPILLDAWSMLTDDASRIATAVAFAFDVSPNRSSGVVAAAGKRSDGLSHGEIVAHDRGTGWMVDRLVEIDDAHENVGVFCDAVGPAASLIPELESRGVTVTTVSAADHARACGLLFDEVDQATLRHLGTKELDAAIAGAAKRPLGDAWAWSRKTSKVDISPLVAFTIALWGASTVKPPQRSRWRVVMSDEDRAAFEAERGGRE